MYSTPEVARILGLAPVYMRVLLHRHPHLAPKKVANTWVWTQADIDRVKDWRDRNKEDEPTK